MVIISLPPMHKFLRSLRIHWSHVRIGASKVAIKTCRKTNLAGTRAPPRNRVANTKIIFVLARLRIAPLASDWPGTFQEFIEGYGGEMLEPTRPLST